MICKLALQVIKQTENSPEDSMDILQYVKVKRVPGWDRHSDLFFLESEVKSFRIVFESPSRTPKGF